MLCINIVFIEFSFFFLVGKLTNILQFITGIGFNEGGGASGSGHYRLKSHRFIGVVVATSFCKMTRLLYSKDSIVTTKVQYSLTNLKKDSIDVSGNISLNRNKNNMLIMYPIYM